MSTLISKSSHWTDLYEVTSGYFVRILLDGHCEYSRHFEDLNKANELVEKYKNDTPYFIVASIKSVLEYHNRLDELDDTIHRIKIAIENFKTKKVEYESPLINQTKGASCQQVESAPI